MSLVKNKRKGTSKDSATLRRRGVPRAMTQASVYRFRRTLNASNATGLSVDAIYCSKSGSNVVMSTGSSAGTVYFGGLSYYFILTDVPTYTEMTSLFDQYRVDKIELKLYSYCTSAASGAAVTATYGQTGVLVHDVVDYDDATVPTASDAGAQALREYQNYKCRSLINSMGAPIVRSWSPHIATAAYTGSFTGYKNEPFGWVDCGSTTVQGYGWKCLFEAPSPGGIQNVIVKIEATVDLAFRNVR